MVNEEVKFIDAEAYRGGNDEKLTFKMIILEHLRKIGGYSAVEFRGGYWETREINTPHVTNVIRIYIPDSREVYSNSVEYLYDLLYPHFDEEMKKDGLEYEEELKEAFSNNTYVKQRDRESDDDINDREFKDVIDRVTFRTQRRLLCRKLFRSLSCFLHRMKYMDGKTFSEEL